MNKIQFSQLIGLIQALFETNKIQIRDGYLAWATEEAVKRDLETGRGGSHNLSIKWLRSGYIPCYLCMTLDGVDKYGNYYFTAYYFDGDNCNDRTQFLFWLMSEEIKIVDDLGIVGHGNEIGKTHLTKLSHTEWRKAVVNARGKTVIYHKGQWKYKEEVEVVDEPM